MDAQGPNSKQRAADAAIPFLRSNSIIGLGTGSTADYFLASLSTALRTGRLSGIKGVPTSDKTNQRAKELGIPLVPLSQVEQVDVTVDGADEVTPSLNLIKGMGGALLREKMVAQNSKNLIIIADASKRVQVLGTKSPLPVEVVQFCHESQVKFFESLGCAPLLRTNADGKPFVTDNGNYIYDCKFDEGIVEPVELQSQLSQRAGVVETGLFLAMAKLALIGDDKGVVMLKR